MNGNVIGNTLDMDMPLPTDLAMELTVSQFTADPNYHPRAMIGDMSLMNMRAIQQDSGLMGAGAGPLPTGFGMPPQGGSSTLTEFMKSRNWSQRIVAELKDFLHILTPDGRILYASPSCKSITGYDPHNLIGKFIRVYIHPDDRGIFLCEFNESMVSENPLRLFYRFKKEDGTYIIFDCEGHPHITPEPSLFNYNDGNSNGTPPTGVCWGFFMTARPHPTRNAALLDSTLEHKIDNERLLECVEELRRQEVEEMAEQNCMDRATASTTRTTPSVSQAAQSRMTGDATPDLAPGSLNYHGMPPPAKPPLSDTALTRQNLSSALSAQKPDSILDKMSRYEAESSHLESVELLTGLRYRDGERSHGISTGNASPALITGDAGMSILLDRGRDRMEKEKRTHVVDDCLCADCGTLDSPEWRTGPNGPRTVCNACGLRRAKKKKKKKKKKKENNVSRDYCGKVRSLASMPPPEHPKVHH